MVMLGVIADDFTGASDIAAMLSRGGMSTSLLIGVPAGGPPPVDAAVVALKSRSIAATEAVAQSRAALRWLRGAGATQFVFKYCSTFDSTPDGNIGPVGEALAADLGVKGVVACPALPENGRTVYQGHLFVRDRLLSESGLEKHPLNPMTDPDIRRWLARQCRGPVGLVNHATVARGAAAIRDALVAATETLVIVDAIDDADLVAIGRAAADAPLITGGSGVAMGLPAIYREAGRLGIAPSAWRAVSGPGLVLSGSCSPQTRRQVLRYAAAHPAEKVSIEALMRGDDEAARLLSFARKHRDDEPLIYSSADPEEVAAAQQRHGRDRLAHSLESLFGALAVAARGQGVARLVVAGGETSGAVVSALALHEFAIGPEIAPGVPALHSSEAGALALALKSGNFGDEEFFARALAALGGNHG